MRWLRDIDGGTCDLKAFLKKEGSSLEYREKDNELIKIKSGREYEDFESLMRIEDAERKETYLRKGLL